MSVLDEPFTNAKTGWSSICRAGDHKTCQMAKARCVCDCHGARQEPPAPRPQEVPAVSEATVTALPSKPVAVPDFRCDDCGRTFERPQALGRHRSATHGTASKAKPAKAPRQPAPPKPAPVQPASERQLLAIVGQAYHDLNGADVATCIDSAAEILDAITNAGWRIVEA